MPDIHSIGLGGGSRVRAGQEGGVTVGPDSVGHYVRPAQMATLGQKLTCEHSLPGTVWYLEEVN